MLDVCLLLEGTYPYVAGGVSTWVHQLVTAMRDIRFALVYIGPHSDPTRKIKYELPDQVLYLQEIYLHDYELRSHLTRKPVKKDYQTLEQFYAKMIENDYTSFQQALRLFTGENAVFDTERLFTSREIWELLTHFYDRFATGISFLDFFWTWRGIHLPLMQILQTKIPRAKIYHSVSTGYAGLLGAIAKVEYGGKYFLTEHGIYTHERMLEISQANWIFEQEKGNFRADRDMSFFKKWWLSVFQKMSSISYHFADQMITLFEGNKIRETLEGANPDKISIIPNGIDLNDYKNIPIQKKAGKHVGLVGRVVNIKDIKTFIQAANLVMIRRSDTHFYIVGPTDEEEEYYEECKTLVETLRLEENVHFTGRVDVKKYYSFLDVVVLTSISEAQPYVILEANILGIPVVATDVGACREMLEGRDLNDKAFGASGMITEVANPQNTAEAILHLLSDASFYQQLSSAGIKRVKKYYDQDDLLSRYLNLYEQNL